MLCRGKPPKNRADQISCTCVGAEQNLGQTHFEESLFLSAAHTACRALFIVRLPFSPRHLWLPRAKRFRGHVCRLECLLFPCFRQPRGSSLGFVSGRLAFHGGASGCCSTSLSVALEVFRRRSFRRGVLSAFDMSSRNLPDFTSLACGASEIRLRAESFFFFSVHRSLALRPPCGGCMG